MPLLCKVCGAPINNNDYQNHNMTPENLAKVVSLYGTEPCPKCGEHAKPRCMRAVGDLYYVCVKCGHRWDNKY